MNFLNELMTGFTAPDRRKASRPSCCPRDKTALSEHHRSDACTNRVVDIFQGLFTAKNLHDGNQMMSFRGPHPIPYIDATSGGI